MLELLADAGPMALPIWAVLLWSVAMYPMGFLFGACSDCCDGCGPCDTCVHRLKGGDPVGETFGCLAPFTTITVTTNYETVTFSDWLPDSVDEPIQVQIGVDANSDPLHLTIEGMILIFPFAADNCGCFVCAYRILAFAGLSSGVNIGLDPETNQKTPNASKAYVVFDKCSQTSDTLTDDVTERLEFLFPGAEVDGTISVTVEYDACECGACCLDSECSENVTEFACEDPYDYLGTPKGTWQGVGTDCDPNPCPQPGACCVNGECYQATEAQCGIDGGAWQAGPCDPNPC